GELIAAPFVSENGRRYTPGASAELGSEGAPDTFGVNRPGAGARIVWPYPPADETRTFTVGYRLSGVAVAYDDVVDVNLRVWGDEWKTGLGQLTATMKL